MTTVQTQAHMRKAADIYSLSNVFSNETPEPQFTVGDNGTHADSPVPIDTPAILELRTLPQWVGCKYPDKAPLNPHTGYNASSTNSNTWGTYDQAVAARSRYGWNTIGPSICESDGLAMVDLDHAASYGVIQPWAQEIIEMIDSYTEYSPSYYHTPHDHGVRIVCRGEISKGVPAYKGNPGKWNTDSDLQLPGVPNPPRQPEIYSEKRWITITGYHVPGTLTTIEDRQGELTRLYDETLEKRDKHKAVVRAAKNGNNQPASQPVQSNSDNLRPGDDYNERGPEPTELLERCGWTVHSTPNGKIRYTRPGKNASDGLSAEWDASQRVFYVFSGNASPFDGDTGYSLFQVYALLEHGGDFKETARELGELGYGSSIEDSNFDMGLLSGFGASVYEGAKEEHETYTDQEQDTQATDQGATVKPPTVTDDDTIQAILDMDKAGRPFPWIAKQLGIKPGAVKRIIEAVPDLAMETYRELPKSAQLDTEMARDGCPWLDEYVRFSRQWSPSAYEGYHAACGLWLLSTIAANRVHHYDGGKKHTGLYIILFGRTGIFAKSTTAALAKTVIRCAEMWHLLAPDDMTPQRLIQRMSGWIPSGYGEMSDDDKEKVKEKIAFAGQQGWYSDEIGGQFEAMVNGKGAKAEWRSILRELHGIHPDDTYRKETVTSGHYEIERPYLSLLGACTPADLHEIAQKNSKLWGDGFLARFAFVSPSLDTRPIKAYRPDEDCYPPDAIVNALIDWHKRLGSPEVKIYEGENGEGEPNGHFTYDVWPPDGDKLRWADDAKEASYQYHWAMTDLLADGQDFDTDGNLIRQNEKAQRIAALFASLEGSGIIEMRHWAKAQEIAEQWRFDLHKANEQIQLASGKDNDLPEKITVIVKKHQDDKKPDGNPLYPLGMTLAELCKFVRGASKDGSDKRQQVVDALETACSFLGLIKRNRPTRGKPNVYYMPTGKRKK